MNLLPGILRAAIAPLVWILCVLGTALPQEVQAQDRMVSGSVKDETGSTLPGVSVVVKGTTRGTTTDGSGKYQLNLPNPNTTLVFSFVGY